MIERNAKELGREILTVPNALSLLRLLMVPVVVVLILAGRDTLAVAVFVLAAVTDFVDGKIARRTRPTHIGTILDPLADRLMLSSVGVALAVRGFLPAWVVTILVGRDLLALLGGLKYRGKVRVNLVGKAATATLMIGVALVIFSPGPLGAAVFYVGFGLSLIAGLLYLFSIARISGGGGAL